MSQHSSAVLSQLVVESNLQQRACLNRVPQIWIHHQKIMSTLTATLVVLLCLASSACAAAATAASVAPTPPLQLREAFNERAKAFLSDVVENDRSHDTYAELTRLALGKEGVTGAGMQSSFAKMWARQVGHGAPVAVA